MLETPPMSCISAYIAWALQWNGAALQNISSRGRVWAARAPASDVGDAFWNASQTSTVHVCVQQWILLPSCQDWELPNEQSQQNNLQYQLLQEVPASWNSIYYMLQSFTEWHRAAR